MKGDVIISEFVIVIKTSTDVKKTLQFSTFWPDTNDSSLYRQMGSSLFQNAGEILQII